MIAREPWTFSEVPLRSVRPGTVRAPNSMLWSGTCIGGGHSVTL